MTWFKTFAAMLILSVSTISNAGDTSVLDALLEKIKAGTNEKVLAPLADVGIASNDNFTVTAPVGNYWCERLLAEAQQIHSRLGLPPGTTDVKGDLIETDHILVMLSYSDSLIPKPDDVAVDFRAEGEEGDHRVYIRGDRDNWKPRLRVALLKIAEHYQKQGRIQSQEGRTFKVERRPMAMKAATGGPVSFVTCGGGMGWNRGVTN